MEHGDLTTAPPAGIRTVVQGTILAALAASAVVLSVSCGRAAQGPPAAENASSRAVVPAATANSNLVSCSTTATASIEPSDDPQGRRAAGFAPGLPPPAGMTPLNAQDAISIARAFRASHGEGAAPATAPATAQEMTYSDWTQLQQVPADKFINPARCVWLVKVAATFVVAGPPGNQSRTYASYYVVLDAGSHGLISIGAP